MNRSGLRRLWSITICLPLLGAWPASAQQLVFTPFHPNGIYSLGEKAGWNVTFAGAAVPPEGSYSYTIKSNNLDVVSTGRFDLSSGRAAIVTALDEPGMLYVTIDHEAVPGPPPPSPAEVKQVDDGLKALLVKTDPALQAVFDKYPGYVLIRPPFPFGSYAEDRVATLGAAVAPTRLQPSVPRPADFDSFWSAKLDELKKIPLDPVLAPAPAAQSGVRLFTVTLASVGSHVHGYLAEPDEPGKFPALVIYQWAGVYALNPWAATNRAAEGWLVFDVDSHDLAPDRATGVPRSYQAIGSNDREKSYFLDMYLRDTRAIDYIRSRPEWDGKTLVVTGTSMGGQQSLVTAGLNPGRVTAVIVNEPSGADSNGDLHGRRAGYPNWDSADPQVMKTALYFDTVNFATHINAPTLMAIGFLDTAAPPAGLWAAFNQIPAPKEVIPMVESAHNNLTPDKQGAYLQRSEEVLATILKGGEFKPNQGTWRGY